MTERALKDAERRAAAATAAVKKHEQRLASEQDAGKSELRALKHTARWGSGCAKTEAELRLAKLGAAEAARKQRRLTAKLQVAETEVGLLLAERSLAQAQQTVAEEVAVAAVAACGAPGRELGRTRPARPAPSLDAEGGRVVSGPLL